jgi:hypothetical protein
LTLDVALAYIPTDACWRNGSLFFLKIIVQLKKWRPYRHQNPLCPVTAGKKGVFGDFDTLGYYYVGGTKTV